MRKKVFALMMVAILTVMMAMPVFAAGLNSSEEALYTYFSDQVKSKSWLGAELTNEYLTEAENALAKVDLDQAACDELKGAIDAVMKILNDNNVQSLHEAKQFRDQFLNAVNPIANKYGMSVDLDAKGGIATVLVNGEPVSGGSTVKQTGFSMGTTAAVLAVLAAAGLCAFVVVRKKGEVA